MSPISAAVPGHWTSDVLLPDGDAVRVRPISPTDADGLRDLHERLSDETRYLRFFSPKPRLSDREVERFTNVDHDTRVALVAELGSTLVAVARFDRTAGADEAEVAFVVVDEHQGRGIATVLLEHLASAARERGVNRFVAETMPHNRQMLQVFRAAGFEERTRFGDGLVHVEMLIEPTDLTRAVVEGREHRAEAASVGRLLTPRSIAVIGASADPATVGHQVFRNLLAGGFPGPVYPVNPTAPHVASVKAYESVTAVPGDVDLAVIAVPAAAVEGVVDDCATKGVSSLVVLSGGFSQAGASDRPAEEDLREQARRYGMRVVGPNCIGVVNTAVGLHATFSPYAPPAGRIAMQSQSGALGIAVLERSARVGLGLSSFVSVGNKVDISGNDLLQYWEDDPQTDVVLLYLEAFGNPRKFSRIARRVSRRKPIVAVKSGRTAEGRRAASSQTSASRTAFPSTSSRAGPDVAVDALFRQTGVIRVDTLDELFDMALVLGTQPLPAGNGVAIVGNSSGPGILAADACAGVDLSVPELAASTQTSLRSFADPNASTTNPVDLVAGATSADYERAVRAVLEDEAIDSVIVICTPTFASPARAIETMLCSVAASQTKPVVGVFLASPSTPPLLRDDRRSGDGAVAVPAFGSPEPAAIALARAAGYAAWRRRSPGLVPELDQFDPDAARLVVMEALSSDGAAGGVTAELDRAQTARLLTAIGVPAPADETDGSAAGGEMQESKAAGVEVIVDVVQDRLFGPLVGFGLAGIATDLLGDRAFRVLPVTDLDAADLVRSPRSSPLLFGHAGSPPVAVDVLEDVIQRIARLAGAVNELAELEVRATVGPDGVVVGQARVRVEPVAPGPPADLRRLR